MLPAFEHQGGGALAEDHSVARGVERAQGMLRRPAPCGHQALVAADPRHRMDAAAAAAGDDDVGQSAFDQPHRFGDRQQARSFAHQDRVIGSPGIVGDGDVTGRHVRQELEHPKRKQFAHSLLAPQVEIELAVGNATAECRLQLGRVAKDHVGTEHDAESVGIDAADRQSGFFQGQAGPRRTRFGSRAT